MTQEKKSIVLIDANTHFVEDLQQRFQLEHEFQIVAASGFGMDGFAKAQAFSPAFVVIGYPLPDADVIQLIVNLRHIAPQAKLICTLETENAIVASQFMNNGAHYVLNKPYSVEKLIEVMKRVDQITPMATFSQAGHSNMTASPFEGQQGFPSQMGGMQENMGGGAMFPNQQNQMNYPMQGGQGGQTFPQQNQSVPQGQGYSIPQQGGFPQGQPFPNQSGQAFPQSGGFPPPQMPGSGFPQQQEGFPPPQPQQGGFPPQMPYMGGDNFAPSAGGTRTIKQTVIAVNCPKGGVGKTTISKELALAYATVKVQGQPLKVCLVDCDLDFGDVSSMLKLNPYPNITHWTSDIAQRLRENPNAQPRYSQGEIESKYLITHPTGLKVLAAPSNHTDALDITGKEMEVVIENLKNCGFDVIILDTGNNTKDYSLIALEKANNVLMVITLEITSIQDTNSLLQTLRSIQFPTSKIRLVVNKMPKSDKDIDTSEISQLLNCEIIGFVPDYPKIRTMNNAGTPAILAKPTEFSEAVRKIAHKVIPVFNQRASASAGNQGGAESGGKKGFFGKLFNK
jgi:MinD-like ATPase involved in chromosome partitioning or flagellar assembly/DNA-binding NarL/FixJ family response regulator